MTILVSTVKWLRIRTARRMAKRRSSIERKRRAQQGHNVKEKEHGAGTSFIAYCCSSAPASASVPMPGLSAPAFASVPMPGLSAVLP